MNKDLNINIQYIDVKLLKQDENNTKIHTPEQIEYLRNSIRNYGFVAPLGISENYKILKGNGSFQAAVLEGYSELPCVFWSHLTEEQQEALAIIDNALTLQTNFDFEKLNFKLEEFNLDLSGFGLDFDMNLQDMKNKEIDVEDFDELPPELQGKDLTPDDLEKLKGDDETLMRRVIITYSENRQFLRQQKINYLIASSWCIAKAYIEQFETYRENTVITLNTDLALFYKDFYDNIISFERNFDDWKPTDLITI